MTTAAPLKIRHLATGLSAQFSNYFLTEFQDTIDSTYNKTATFGRMDPLVTFQGAQRKIALAIEVHPIDDLDRQRIQKRIRDMQKMQYPMYEQAGNALTISRPPLVGVTLGNLIRGGDGAELLCAMDGFAFTPRTGFTPEDSPFIRFGAGAGGESLVTTSTTTTNGSSYTTRTGELDGGNATEVTFKKYSLRFDLIPLHRFPMGFSIGPEEISDTEFQGRINPPRYYGGQAASIRFLGGFYFGPHTQKIDSAAEDQPPPNVFNTAGEDEETSIHVIAAESSIFDL